MDKSEHAIQNIQIVAPSNKNIRNLKKNKKSGKFFYGFYFVFNVMVSAEMVP